MARSYQHRDPKPSPPLAYRVNDAARAVGLGRTKIYALIKTGKLASVLVGGRRLILADSLKALLEQ